MTKNEIKLAVLDQVINLLELTQKLICPGCAKGDVLNMNGDHGLGPAGANMGLGLSTCHGKELRQLVQYIRAGVMLKIPRKD